MTGWTLQDWSTAIGLGEIVVGVIMIMLGLYLRNGYTTRREYTALSQRVEQVEKTSSEAATREQLHGLTLEFAKLAGQNQRASDKIDALGDRLNRDIPALTNSVQRIEDFLLHHGARDGR